MEPCRTAATLAQAVEQPLDPLLQPVVQRQSEDFCFQRIEVEGFGNRRQPPIDRCMLPVRQARSGFLQRPADLAPVLHGNAAAPGMVECVVGRERGIGKPEGRGVLAQPIGERLRFRHAAVGGGIGVARAV